MNPQKSSVWSRRDFGRPMSGFRERDIPRGAAERFGLSAPPGNRRRMSRSRRNRNKLDSEMGRYGRARIETDCAGDGMSDGAAVIDKFHWRSALGQFGSGRIFRLLFGVQQVNHFSERPNNV